MSTSDKPRILVLGGGFAGMFAAKELAKRFRGAAAIDLINENNYFVFQPLLPEVAAGSISIRDAVAPLRRLLPGARLRQARIHDVDFDRRIVTVFLGQQRRYTEIEYDHLVLAPGQEVDLSRMPGLTEHAMTMKNLADAVKLRNHVINKLEHADITGMPEVKNELLTFTVVGGGFSGVETVGEMQELIHRSLKFYPSIDPSEVRILLLEFADRLLAELPESLASYAKAHLERKGVEVMLKTGVASATGTHIFTTSGDRIGTRTLVATIGNAPSALVAQLDIAKEHGRIKVDRSMQVEGRPNVWALGDAALIPLVDAPSARDDYAPPTAQFAVREARVLAENLHNAVNGHAPKPFAYKSKGALASLGARRGVGEIFGVRVSGYLGWLIWRAYYLSFLPGFALKARVAMNWLLDGMVGRSTVQTALPNKGSAEFARYSAGDRVFEAGNRATGFFIVTEGRFELRYPAEDGQDEQVFTFGPGEHFGERVLLGDRLRTGSVRAVEDSRVLIVNAEDFKRIAGALPVLTEYFTRLEEEKFG